MTQEPVPPRRLQRQRAARPGDDLPEVPGEGAGPALRRPPRTWPRTWAGSWRPSRSWRGRSGVWGGLEVGPAPAARACLTAAVLGVTVLGHRGDRLAIGAHAWPSGTPPAGSGTGADLVAAAAALQVQTAPAARRILRRCPEPFRQWEWHHFHSQLGQLPWSSPGTRARSAAWLSAPTAAAWPGRRPGPHAGWREVATGRESPWSGDSRAIPPSGGLQPGRPPARPAGVDGSVRLWDADRRPARRVPGHAGPVRVVAFSPDGSGASSRRPRRRDDPGGLWDADTGSAHRPAAGPGSPPSARTAPALSDAGTDCHPCGGGDDRQARPWRPTRRGPRSVLPGRQPRRPASPSGALPRNAVRLWGPGPGAGSCKAMPTNRVNRPWPSARTAGSSPRPRQDQTVRVWDAASGRPVAVLRGTPVACIGGPLQPGRPSRFRLTGRHHRGLGPADGKPISVLQGHAG